MSENPVSKSAPQKPTAPRIVATMVATVVGHAVDYYPGYEKKLPGFARTETQQPYFKTSLRVSINERTTTVECPDDTIILLDMGDAATNEMTDVVYNDLKQLHPFGSSLRVIGKEDSEGRWLEFAPPSKPPAMQQKPLTQKLGDKLKAMQDKVSNEEQLQQ